MAKKSKNKGRKKSDGKGRKKAGSNSGKGKPPAKKAADSKRDESWIEEVFSRALPLLDHPVVRLATHPAVLIPLLFVLALAVRYYLAGFYAKGPDNFQYLALAKDIATGAYFRADFDLDMGLINSRRVVPLFPFLIALGMKFGADPEWWATWVVIISGALAVVPMFGLGMRLGNKAVALTACVFYAVHPMDCHTSGLILTESTFNLLTLSAIWAVIWFIDRPSPGRAALVAIVSAYSYLTRDVGFGYFFLALISFSAGTWILRRPRKTAAIQAGIALVVFVVLCVPFWIFVKAHTGNFGPSLRAGGSLRGDLVGYKKGSRPRVITNEEERKQVEAQESKSLATAPGKTIGLAYEYMRETHLSMGLSFSLLMLSGLVLWPSWKREQLPAEMTPLIWALAIAGVYALVTPYMVDRRYYLPISVIACLWAGRGAIMLPVTVGKKINDNSSMLVFIPLTLLSVAGIVGAYYLAKPFIDASYYKALLAIVLLMAMWALVLGFLRTLKQLTGATGTVAFSILALLASAGSVSYFMDGLSSTKYVHEFYSEKNFRGKTVAGHKEVARDANKSLKIDAGSRILSRKPYFAYYLDGLFVENAETMEGVVRQLEAGECDYLFIDSLAVQRYRRGLKPLVTGQASIGGAGLVYRRYLGEYSKLFSVYQPGKESISVGAHTPTPGQIPSVMSRAAEYKNHGYYEHARQLFEAVLRSQSNVALARRELIKIYLIYGAFDGVSLDKAEDQLMKYSYLNPDDPLINEYRKNIQEVRIIHQSQWGMR